MLKSQVESLASTKENKEKNIESLNQSLIEISLKIDEYNSRIYALKTSISNDTNRCNILKNLQADFEGYQYAVKRLLQEGKTNTKLSNAIKGVVGNIISVDSKYQTAIEIALGGSIQNIVTKDENDAKILIDYLKETKSGRATFLPITAVKPRYLSASDRNYLSSQGCLGVASELVKTEGQYRPVIESLLGSTVVCDTLDNAVLLAKRSAYAFRIVTLEGDVLSPQGSMSGGSKKSNDSSLLSKENEIKNLNKNIEDKSKELSVYEKELSEIFDKQNNFKNTLFVESESLKDVNSDYYTNSTKLENITAKLDTFAEEIFTYQSQIKVAEAVVDDLNMKINSIDQTELDYTATKAKSADFNETTKTAYEELKIRRDEYQERIMSFKVKIASTEEKIRNIERDIDSNNSEIKNIKFTIEQVEKELIAQQKVYDEAVSMFSAVDGDSEVVAIREKLNELNIKLSQFNDFKENLMKELKDLDDDWKKMQVVAGEKNITLLCKHLVT
ncbi:MAG: hypothetical protein IKA36_01660, partial [Clostridia bacterium]|nr:hypothetical protein [Clostridia bacterium]